MEEHSGRGETGWGGRLAIKSGGEADDGCRFGRVALDCLCLGAPHRFFLAVYQHLGLTSSALLGAFVFFHFN